MALTWKLSDGTTVDSNGRVSGDSGCAKLMREDLTRLRAGKLVYSHYGRIPTNEPLSLDAPHLVNTWVRWCASMYGLSVTESSETTYPEPDDDDEEPTPVDPMLVVLH